MRFPFLSTTNYYLFLVIFSISFFQWISFVIKNIQIWGIYIVQKAKILYTGLMIISNKFCGVETEYDIHIHQDFAGTQTLFREIDKELCMH